jgi:hypothetical protein
MNYACQSCHRIFCWYTDEPRPDATEVKTAVRWCKYHIDEEAAARGITPTRVVADRMAVGRPVPHDDILVAVAEVGTLHTTLVERDAEIARLRDSVAFHDAKTIERGAEVERLTAPRGQVPYRRVVTFLAAGYELERAADPDCRDEDP